MEVLFGSIIVLMLASAAAWRWFAGREARWQAAYAQQLMAREATLAGMIADGIGLFRDGVDEKTTPEIVVGQSAVWTPYFGDATPGLFSRYQLTDEDRYADLCRLARREAVARMLENAREAGFNAVCDVAIESADLGRALNASQRAMFVVTAVGTAYCINDEAPTRPAATL